MTRLIGLRGRFHEDASISCDIEPFSLYGGDGGDDEVEEGENYWGESDDSSVDDGVMENDHNIEDGHGMEDDHDFDRDQNIEDGF